MSQLIIRILLIFGIFLLIDIYTFQAVKTAFSNRAWSNYFYWGLTALILFYMIYALSTFDRAAGPNKVVNVFMGIMILTYVPKLFVVIFLFSEDIIRVLQGSITWLADFLNISNTTPDRAQYIPGRRAFVSQVGLALAAIPLSSIIYGMWKGKYDYRVIRQVLHFDDLPDAFDGFTIAQISDIHSGSFDNKEKIEYGINLLNDQNPDLVLFTGDLVNNKAEEMEPWIESFSRLQAKYGKYSILGNHDYGDYISWESAQAKVDNMNRLYQVHEELGFKLMLNENTHIEKNGEQIALLGVENWGKPPFPQHGDLKKAMTGVNADAFKILMSHDPSHFDEEVKHQNEKIHLTLSGHTHGMQFGIEIPGLIKWSPVKYRYPKWAGLYEDLGRYLYVNRGFGYLAFPGRVGILAGNNLNRIAKSMKRIVIFSIALLAVLACKKEEQPAPAGPNEWIVGYWEMTDLEVSGSVTIAGSPLPLNGEGKNYTGGYQLNSDKTANYDFSCDVELIVPGVGTVPIPFTRTGNGTWQLTDNNKTLVVTEGGGQVTAFPIKVLTENIMILEQDSTFNMGGFSGSINYEVTLEK